MATTARLDLSVWRNDDVWEFPLRIRGPNLTGVAIRAQIRLAPDTPGAPLANLATVTNGNAEGIRLASVALVDGVWTNDVRVRLNKSTRQGLPYSGELGESAALAWALQIGGRTRLVGSILLLAHVIDSNAAPTNRSFGFGGSPGGLPSGGATLTIAGDDVSELRFDGADIALAAGAAALAAQTAAELAAATALAASRFFATRSDGETGSAAGQLFSTDDGAGNLIYYRRTSGGSIEIGRAITPAALAAGTGGALVGYVAAGAGAVARTLMAKARERVSVYDFGAVGDGNVNDTAAIKAAINAVPPGGQLHLGTGAFLVNESFVFTKPIQIIGAAKELCYFVFAPVGAYVTTPDGDTVGMWFLHSNTNVTGFSGDARRSVLSGFSLNGSDRVPASMIGCVISTPIYLYEVDAFNFGKDGFAVLASIAGDPDDAAGLPRGNANGTSFTNCQAISNGRHGFHLLGDNSNACFLLGCRAPANAGRGFADDSLLGNAYVACEADNNGAEGYWSNPAKPSASSYLSCYSETAPHFNVGPLCVMWGAQGLYKPSRSSGGVIFRGLPAGGAYCSQPIRIASTDDIANAGGEGANPGAYMSVGDDGWEFRADASRPKLKFNGLLSPNYAADYTVNGTAVIRFPASAFTGNVAPSRPHLPNGLTIGDTGKSGIVGSGSTTPVGGDYAPGAIWLNEAPTIGTYAGWVVTNDRTWHPFGKVDA